MLVAQTAPDSAIAQTLVEKRHHLMKLVKFIKARDNYGINLPQSRWKFRPSEAIVSKR